ncbi:MAG: hypothetical protein E6230_03165 [Paenibacillus dendritiformis]|uniref:hypothetical protein n=1 Tax=uncultured Paenibacillus sp. TaxID=227322 RepID=UPI0025D8B9CE|nr:hypothetical protein [uncultured Paenibacillus sp.]MDU5141171.1 hypothetical protein [Paenibacillus dendritiformis]
MKILKILVIFIFSISISACYSNEKSNESNNAFTKLTVTEVESIGLSDWNVKLDTLNNGVNWVFDISLDYLGTGNVSKLRLKTLGYESERETDFKQGLKIKGINLVASSTELVVDIAWYIDGKEYKGYKKYNLLWG